MASGPPRGPKEINQTNIALQDVTQKVRFPPANANGRTPPPIITAAGMVPILPGTTYMLTTTQAGAGLHFFLSRADVNNNPGAATGNDIFIPQATIFTFFSGEYDQFSADGVDGTLMALSL